MPARNHDAAAAWLTRRQFLGAGAFTLALTTLGACRWRPHAAMPTQDPAITHAPQALAMGESLWQNAAITSYRITVSIAPFGPITTITLTVMNGVIVNQDVMCQFNMHPTTCASSIKGEEYTVPGLFATAQALLGDPQQETTIDVDPIVGYPRLISSRPNPRADARTDLGYSIHVDAFAVLPPQP